MALSYLKLFQVVRRSVVMRHNVVSFSNHKQLVSKKEFKTENNIRYMEDPDSFGNLSGYGDPSNQFPEDEGDLKEEQYLQNKPIKNQKLTIRQYADLMKQYIKHKRIKEAIDVLEVRMLKQDQAKPENYLYNILIGACADVGYTKKAFKLFNDMKRRALQPTGDTYTCLFEACANSPYPENGMKNAHHLRELMLEKNIEPNLTNYNTMIKAFGRCGDLITAFRLIDEMKNKKIKIRVHTYNHLLQACISDKESGLRHALIIWRKMLKNREKPNIYSFNLLLKCVKDCNVGNKEDMIELINNIEQQITFNRNHKNTLQIESSLAGHHSNPAINSLKPIISKENSYMSNEVHTENSMLEVKNNPKLIPKNDEVKIELIEKLPKPNNLNDHLPNLLSNELQMDQVLEIKEVKTPQERFAIVGGLRGFLEEMAKLSVKPDIKTYTQMLPLLNDTEEENKLLDFMKNADVRTDIDFYNMLIKCRSMRREYEDAMEVMSIIKKEQELRKKRFFHNKKRQLKVDIMTYGALALACETKEKGQQLLSDLNEKQIKVNIQILGTLLRHGTSNLDFKYILYVMDVVKEENIQVNDIFLKHLESFSDKCANLIEQHKKGQNKISRSFPSSYQNFSRKYTDWLKSINVEEALKPERPWEQFKESYPETLQKQNIEIKEPKKFYKRNRKMIKYRPQIV